MRPGESTINDAILVLGKPTSTSTLANGSTLLQWQYSQGTLIGGNGAHVAVLFDSRSRMVRVTHRTIIGG
ncbi:MAG: hypothetical protein JF606_29810 [Burkholderiales bacterium]|nr:hypothetical protein [Burkholderiales bacterium]